MWLKDETVRQIEDVASFVYIDVEFCARWNARRREGELRLLTGWQWTERGGSRSQRGLKTKTAAMIDAYYALIAKMEAPSTGRPKLRVVERRAA